MNMQVNQKNWQELIRPTKIDIQSGKDKKRMATVVAEPLERGFGTTLGNALRRILLSSLQGAAVTAIQIDGVLHEFSSIAGVREDVTDMIMNIKEIAFVMHAEGPKRLTLKKGPNVVRAVLGHTSKVQGPKSKAGGALDWETDTIAVLETNLDDINAEWLGGFVEQALAGGALDVFHTPVQMKKNRPGVVLTVLCDSDDAERFSEMILRETTAFGVRRTLAERRKLRREVVKVKTKFGEVAVKIGRLNNRIVQAAPEFESCRTLAEKGGVPLREIYAAALSALKL